MRDYGKVHTTFWSSTTIRGLSEDARVLALYLLTSPHGTIAGVFRLPDGYACEDLQWSPERVREGFRELFANGFANRCETTKWVWIVKHFDWNPPENPNQRKAAAKIARTIPDECVWKPDFMRVYGDSLGIEWNQDANRSETVPKPFANQKQEQEQEQEQDKRSARKSARTPSVQFSTWVSSLTEGEDAIPPDDPVFRFAADAGIPDDMLALAWSWFERTYTGSRKTKRYSDWRQVFRNAVQGNWGKLWRFTADGQCVLTSEGEMLRRALEAKARRAAA